MKQTDRKKRNYIIMGLCAVLALMAAGYAAFSSQLTINSSSEITSNWDVEITGISVLETHSKTASGVTDNNGSPSYDRLTASFSVNLTSPGDYRIYKIRVNNLGSLNAKLDSI